MNPLTHSKNTTILPVPIAVVLVCFALSPQARATCQEACLTNNNTVLGDNALINNTTGNDNTAVGASALEANTIGGDNTATGVGALRSNTTGSFNTVTGVDAMDNNTTGDFNTATGFGTLGGFINNSSGGNNTATGSVALSVNSTGSFNTATGVAALVSNTTGSENTANGDSALASNTTGNNNTADGAFALYNTTGAGNIALGFQAGQNLTTGNNNIDIGNKGVAGEGNTIRIGRKGTQTTTIIAGISGATVPTGVPVIIDTNNHLGTTTSSARFKEQVKPMEKASEAILALKPVTFRYKKDLDPDGVPQFGLLAEEVEKVNPDLVARDEQGKPYTVRYEAVNAMLLNEFLKARRQIDAQQKQIDALTAGLQEVKAQVATSRLTPQTVVSNR